MSAFEFPINMKIVKPTDGDVFKDGSTKNVYWFDLLDWNTDGQDYERLFSTIKKARETYPPYSKKKILPSIVVLGTEEELTPHLMHQIGKAGASSFIKPKGYQNEFGDNKKIELLSNKFRGKSTTNDKEKETNLNTKEAREGFGINESNSTQMENESAISKLHPNRLSNIVANWDLARATYEHSLACIYCNHTLRSRKFSAQQKLYESVANWWDCVEENNIKLGKYMLPILGTKAVEKDSKTIHMLPILGTKAVEKDSKTIHTFCGLTKGFSNYLKLENTSSKVLDFFQKLEKEVSNDGLLVYIWVTAKLEKTITLEEPKEDIFLSNKTQEGLIVDLNWAQTTKNIIFDQRFHLPERITDPFIYIFHEDVAENKLEEFSYENYKSNYGRSFQLFNQVFELFEHL